MPEGAHARGAGGLRCLQLHNRSVLSTKYPLMSVPQSHPIRSAFRLSRPLTLFLTPISKSNCTRYVGQFYLDNMGG